MKTNNQEPKPFKAGEIIYSHNDPAEFIFLIHSGKVRIESKHGLELGILETGEIFGEVGHIIESPRTVTAIAMTNALIRVIDEILINFSNYEKSFKNNNGDILIRKKLTLRKSNQSSILTNIFKEIIKNDLKKNRV